MLYAKRKAVRYMCKQTVTQHLAKRDSRLPAYGSVVLQIFFFHEGIYEEKRIRNVLLFSLHSLL